MSIHELYEEDGFLFITMELVEGSNLRTALEDRQRLVLDLFAPGRRMAATVPLGMDVVYISFERQHLVEAVTPWRYAAVGRIKTAAESQYLEVNSDRLRWTHTMFWRSGRA